MNIKHIVLDVWQTILKGNPVYREERAKLIKEMWLSNCAGAEQWIDNSFSTMKVILDHQEVSTGRSIPYDFKHIMLVHEMGMDITVSTDPRWHKLFDELFLTYPPTLLSPNIPHLIKGWMAAGIKVSILSNTHFIAGRVMQKALWSLGVSYHHKYFSDEGVMCKPNSQLAKGLMHGLPGYEANEVLMIGDSEICDIIPCKTQGMNTFQINGPESWEELKALSIYEKDRSALLQ